MSAGLCSLCAHQRVVVSGRGSTFSLCLRAREDSRFAKYPRVPVLTCAGYEPRGSEAEDPEPPSSDG